MSVSLSNKPALGTWLLRSNGVEHATDSKPPAENTWVTELLSVCLTWPRSKHTCTSSKGYQSCQFPGWQRCWLTTSCRAAQRLCCWGASPSRTVMARNRHAAHAAMRSNYEQSHDCRCTCPRSTRYSTPTSWSRASDVHNCAISSQRIEAGASLAVVWLAIPYFLAVGRKKGLASRTKERLHIYTYYIHSIRIIVPLKRSWWGLLYYRYCMVHCIHISAANHTFSHAISSLKSLDSQNSDNYNCKKVFVHTKDTPYND